MTEPLTKEQDFYGCNPEAVLKNLQSLAERLGGMPRPNSHPLDCTTIIGHYADKQAATIASLERDKARLEELLAQRDADPLGSGMIDLLPGKNMRDHLIDEHGKTLVQLGDEVENNDASFFVGSINESQSLCSIDKSKPFILKNKDIPMAECIKQGNYSASIDTLRVIESGTISPPPQDALRERIQARIDYHHYQIAEADAQGYDECVKWSEGVIKELETLLEASPAATQMPVPHSVRYDILGLICSVCDWWNRQPDDVCIYKYTATKTDALDSSDKWSIENAPKCAPMGASDYCASCGIDMTLRRLGPCEGKLDAWLKVIPDERIAAFGCNHEAFGLKWGEKEEPCKKWCHNRNCTYALTDTRSALETSATNGDVRP